MTDPVLEKGAPSSAIYPGLDIVDDLDYDEFTEEEAVPEGELSSRTKKLSTSRHLDMQKIVQGDPTKTILESEGNIKALREEEVGNTDRLPALGKDTRHVVYQRENRKQSSFSVRKSRSTSPS